MHICLYTSPQYQAANVNQPPKRGAGERRLVATLAQHTRVQKYRHIYICCSKQENIILSNCQVNQSFPKNFYFFNVMHIYVYIQVPNIRLPWLISHQRGVPAKCGLSPHLHSNTRVQKYRDICCSKLENIIISNCQAN